MEEKDATKMGVRLAKSVYYFPSFASSKSTKLREEKNYQVVSKIRVGYITFARKFELFRRKKSWKNYDKTEDVQQSTI